MNKTDILVHNENFSELINSLKQNNMHQQADELFELASYIDMLENRLEQFSGELSTIQQLINQTYGQTTQKAMPETISETAEKYTVIKTAVTEVKDYIKAKSSEIISDTKLHSKKALNRVSEFLGIKNKLMSILNFVQKSITETERFVSSIESLESGMREAKYMADNTLREFTGKDKIDYTQKENTLTSMFKKPLEGQVRIFKDMERHLNAAIERTDHLAESVSLEKENSMDACKNQSISKRLAEKKAEVNEKSHETDNRDIPAKAEHIGL